MRIPPISILPHRRGLARATNPAIRPTAPLSRGIPITLLLLAMAGSVRVANAQQGDTALAGIWAAKKRFGPDVRGTLLVRRAAGRWRAEIAGRVIEPTVAGRSISFGLPGDEGEFRGRFSADRGRIVGVWMQPQTVNGGLRFASPVALVRNGALWRGEVMPLDDELTFYLSVRPRPDGVPAIVLRNPERNLGWQFRVDALRRTGDSVALLASTRQNRVFAAGTLHEGTLTLDLGGWGGSYDFRRLEPGEASDFWPRGRPDAGWTYAPPPALGDGWRTGTLEEVGISPDSIAGWMRRLVREGDDSVTAPRIHGVLVARHGRLVLEEYFFGTGRDQPHDTRSAAKSLTSTLIGAAMEAGLPIADTTRVYRVMQPGAFAGLEPRRRAMTVAHLMTQASGLDCDDSDPNSPGGEETMLNQTAEPDYAKYALALRMVRDPGTKTVYCSTQPNLAWAVLARAAGRPVPELMQDLLTGPLQMRRYWLPLTPAGDAYGGGAVRVLPREFMKLGELYLRGGRWNGRRVLPAAWARRATSPLTTMGTQGYGYLWWISDIPYRGRTVRAYSAFGNGGQTVTAIPELDLVIALYGGNYADGRRTLYIQRDVVARDILPAVDASR